jgi:hypothetical protein
VHTVHRTSCIRLVVGKRLAALFVEGGLISTQCVLGSALLAAGAHSHVAQRLEILPFPFFAQQVACMGRRRASRTSGGQRGGVGVARAHALVWCLYVVWLFARALSSRATSY